MVLSQNKQRRPGAWNREWVRPTSQTLSAPMGGLSFRKVPGSPPGAPCRAAGCCVRRSGTFCGLPDPMRPGHSRRSDWSGRLSQNLLLLGARGAHGRQGRLQRPPRPGTPRVCRRRAPPALGRTGRTLVCGARGLKFASPLSVRRARLLAACGRNWLSHRTPRSVRFPRKAGKNASRVSRWRFCPPSVCARSARSPGPVLGSLTCTRTRRHAPWHTPVHPHRHTPQHTPVHLHTHLDTRPCTPTGTHLSTRLCTCTRTSAHTCAPTHADTHLGTCPCTHKRRHATQHMPVRLHRRALKGPARNSSVLLLWLR